jgi:hypothetical protein
VQLEQVDNQGVISKRWPELADAIFRGPPMEWELREVGCRPLAIGGLQMASAHGPGLEAELQASRVPENASQAYIYGLGLGDLQRALLERPQLKQLTVVLLNLAEARVTFEQLSDQQWLSDPRIQLEYRPGDRELRTPFSVVPPSLQLADESCHAMRDAVMLRLSEPFIASNWKGRMATISGYLNENKSLIQGDADVAELFQRWRGRDFLIAGPAPTLAPGIAKFQALSQDAVTIAISTALQPLIAAGIQPDLVIMIDAESIDPLEPEQRESFAQTPLVYLAEVRKSTVKAWPGPRYVCYLDRPRYKELRKLIPRANLWTEGTVAHSAIDLAVQCGAAKVTLFGLDFGYPGGESHSAGTPDYMPIRERDRGRTLLDGHGSPISSDLHLITYLRDIEQYISAHPEVSFWRADRRGAAMEGVSWLEE